MARSSLPRHSVPIGFVDDDNLLLIFEHGARARANLDQDHV